MLTSETLVPVRTAGAARPAPRDHTVDVLRFAAMTGIVLGHWLVTALVPHDGALSVDSPLRYQPWLWPTTWILQTLGPFFFAAGFSGAASWDRTHHSGWRAYRGWLATRVARLVLALLYVGAFWAVLLAGLAIGGVSDQALVRLGVLAVSPLWFVGIYLALGALAPVLLAVRRYALPAGLAATVAVVAASDLTRFCPWAVGLPAWLSSTLHAAAVLCAWAFPYQLGMRCRIRPPRARPLGAALLGAGTLVAAVLVIVAGYPATAVGVTGAARSNLSPPSLVAVALAVAQVGAFLLIRPWLASVLASPRVRGLVSRANAMTLPVYLWHQTALLVVLLVGGGFGAYGLLGAPDTVSWLAARLLWLPVLAMVLAALCWLMVRTYPVPWRPHNR